MNFYADDRGTALVEFALFLPLLVVVLFGIFDYSFAIHGSMQIQQAAAAGAAFGVIPGNEGNLSGIQAASTHAATAVNNFTVSATTLWTCSAGGSSVASNSTCSGGVTPYKYVVVNTSGALPSTVYYAGMPANRTLYGSATFQVPWSQ